MHNHLDHDQPKKAIMLLTDRFVERCFLMLLKNQPICAQRRCLCAFKSGRIGRRKRWCGRIRRVGIRGIGWTRQGRICCRICRHGCDRRQRRESHRWRQRRIDGLDHTFVHISDIVAARFGVAIHAIPFTVGITPQDADNLALLKSGYDGRAFCG
jgi:hypothetical protein